MRQPRRDYFHIHTWRCGHAQMVSEDAYIRRAILRGGKTITFCDHAPFPGDPFDGRMRMEQLSEYVQTLKRLKKKYQRWIQVQIGLELEYFPEYADYYRQLHESGDFDVLVLGQHFYQAAPGLYSPSLAPEVYKANHARQCAAALVEGMATGYFDVVAHPDRIFMHEKEFGPEAERIAQRVITAAQMFSVMLEKNLSEKQRRYYPRFWRMIPRDVKTIQGLDAHQLKHLKRK